MTTPSWQERRSRLNHDWLKNVYLGGLAALHARIKNSAPAGMQYIERAFHEDLEQWPEKSDEIKKLIDGFEEQMSPRMLFGESPLNACSQEVMSWLPDLVHELWRFRVGAGNLVETASTSFSNVESEYPVCCKAMEDYLRRRSDQDREDALRRVAALLSACEKLSSAISKFPSRIEVV